MTRTIFIATAEPYSGKSIVALGVVNMLLGKARKVGYFKPIINDDPKEKKDIDIETLVNHFGLQIPYEDTYAFTRQQAMRQPVGGQVLLEQRAIGQLGHRCMREQRGRAGQRDPDQQRINHGFPGAARPGPPV